MRRISAIILFFFSIAIVACDGGGGSGDNHTPMGSLLVTVDDASDDSAVENASVSVYDDKNQIVINSTTDMAGEFEKHGAPAILIGGSGKSNHLTIDDLIKRIKQKVKIMNFMLLLPLLLTGLKQL